MHLIKFKHTCLRKLFKFSLSGHRAQNHKNLLNLNIVKKIFGQKFGLWSVPPYLKKSTLVNLSTYLKIVGQKFGLWSVPPYLIFSTWVKKTCC